MENPIKMEDLGVPLFSETSIWIHLDLDPRWNPMVVEDSTWTLMTSWKNLKGAFAESQNIVAVFQVMNFGVFFGGFLSLKSVGQQPT